MSGFIQIDDILVCPSSPREGLVLVLASPFKSSVPPEADLEVLSSITMTIIFGKCRDLAESADWVENCHVLARDRLLNTGEYRQ